MRFSTFVAVVLVIACSPAWPPDKAAHLVRDSAEIRIVENYMPLWGEVVREVEASPILQIGEVEGEDPYLFGVLGDAKLLPDGNIVATDSRANEVRFFDASGHHVATFGRPGAGPDEFRGVGRVFRYSGDSVAVFDFALSRTLVLPVATGRSRAVTGMYGNARAPLLGVLESGSFLHYQETIAEPVEVGSSTWNTRVLLRLDRSGREWHEVKRILAGEGASGPQGLRRILAPTSVLAASKEGFYWARTDRYEISFYDSLGVLRTLIRRPVHPSPVNANDRAEYVEATLASLRRDAGEGAAQRYDRLFRESEFAGTRPLFWAAFVDVDQRLWLSEWPWPSRFEPPEVWSVFTDKGVWLGDVKAPDDLMIYDALGNTILGVCKDALGVSYLRLYRMHESS